MVSGIGAAVSLKSWTSRRRSSGRQDLQAVQRRRGIGGDLLQKTRQTRDDTRGRSLIEELGAVVETEAEPGSGDRCEAQGVVVAVVAADRA